MITRIKKTTFALFLTLPMVCLMGVLPVPAATVLPQGLVMEDTFSPGRGRPVGIVQQVQGDVVVMHENVLKGYQTERGTPLFKGDTVMTLENGRVRFKLNDGSIISLASETKMKLTESVYQKKKKQRSSFFQMALGKARFFVVKMLDFKRSEFKVKTPTAVCGVRGSDFILEATDAETIATALMDTELEFQSLAFLEEPPMILRDFESSATRSGERPSAPTRMSKSMLQEKTDQFIDVAPEKGAITDEEDMGQDEMDDDTGVDDVGDLGERMSLEDVRPDDLGNRTGFSGNGEPFKNWTPPEIDDIMQSGTEDLLAGEPPEPPELPGFPETPQ